MVSSFTNRLKLEIPGSGDYSGTWDTVANRNFYKVDAALSAVSTVDLSSSNQSLVTSTTAVASADALVIKIIGTLTANRTLTLPADFKGSYIVNNEASMGSYTITFAVSGLTNLVINKDTTSKFIIFSNGTKLESFEGGKTAGAIIGEIRMYAGDITSMAALEAQGWYLCNGQSVPGYGNTIDLRNRFVMGTDDPNSIGAAGGSSSGTTGASTINLNTSTDSHQLTISQIPSHSHYTVSSQGGFSIDLNDSPSNSTAWFFEDFSSNSGTNLAYSLKGVASAATLGPSSSVGGGQGHSHAITANGVGSHTHSFSTTNPLHRKLAYIEYTGVLA